ncbi:putative membrane protein [Synechococcus sp. RS9909]|nr:hypothetical protein RS9917_10861 [Synechococcus sp. RS9917]QNI79798.1 putative membrane protein [Synechococcus sp. RS9909]
MNSESQIWPVVLVSATVVILLMMLSITSTGSGEVVGVG